MEQGHGQARADLEWFMNNEADAAGRNVHHATQRTGAFAAARRVTDCFQLARVSACSPAVAAGGKAMFVACRYTLLANGYGPLNSDNGVTLNY
jgi:hypothetical protein